LVGICSLGERSPGSTPYHLPWIAFDYKYTAFYCGVKLLATALSWKKLRHFNKTVIETSTVF